MLSLCVAWGDFWFITIRLVLGFVFPVKDTDLICPFGLYHSFLSQHLVSLWGAIPHSSPHGEVRLRRFWRKAMDHFHVPGHSESEVGI